MFLIVEAHAQVTLISEQARTLVSRYEMPPKMPLTFYANPALLLDQTAGIKPCLLQN